MRHWRESIPPKQPPISLAAHTPPASLGAGPGSPRTTRNPQKSLQASFNQNSYEFNQSSINVQSKPHPPTTEQKPGVSPTCPTSAAYSAPPANRGALPLRRNLAGFVNPCRLAALCMVCGSPLSTSQPCSVTSTVSLTPTPYSPFSKRNYRHMEGHPRGQDVRRSGLKAQVAPVGPHNPVLITGPVPEHSERPAFSMTPRQAASTSPVVTPGRIASMVACRASSARACSDSAPA